MKKFFGLALVVCLCQSSFSRGGGKLDSEKSEEKSVQKRLTSLTKTNNEVATLWNEIICTEDDSEFEKSDINSFHVIIFEKKLNSFSKDVEAFRNKKEYQDLLDIVSKNINIYKNNDFAEKIKKIE